MGVATGGEIRTNTIVTIETLIYSFRQNKLVWGAQSRTTNPRDVEKVVHSSRPTSRRNCRSKASSVPDRA